MNDPIEEAWSGSTGSLPPRAARALRSIRVDIAWLYRGWMALVYADGRGRDYSVVERQVPRTAGGLAGYRLWGALGVAFLLLAYPLFVLGLATRYYARRIDRVTAGLGFVGVAAVSLLAWGALTVVTYLSPVAYDGFVAVAAAGVVATVSAVLALFVTRHGGRAWTVALGYPFGVTALFLPPVVAALYSPTLASIVFPRSTSLAIWLLDTVLSVGGLAAFIRATFELEGLAYVAMWFALAVPTGWFLGGLVTVASRVRRSGPPGAVEDPDTGLV